MEGPAPSKGSHPGISKDERATGPKALDTSPQLNRTESGPGSFQSLGEPMRFPTQRSTRSPLTSQPEIGRFSYSLSVRRQNPPQRLKVEQNVSSVWRLNNKSRD